MNANFWHQKWERGEIGFHESEGNLFLKEHFEKLDLPKGSRLFLPLCGKTRDIAWLLARGHRVVGAELSEIAIKELFQELGVKPEISQVGKLNCYSAQDVDIFVGDIFDVSADVLGPVSAVYDRAALIALPTSVRVQYASHLMKVTGAAPQLLITFEYNQQLMEGPPFSVDADEVKRLYGAAFALKSIESKSVPGGFRGKIPSMETVWLLPKANS